MCRFVPAKKIAKISKALHCNGFTPTGFADGLLARVNVAVTATMRHCHVTPAEAQVHG